MKNITRNITMAAAMAISSPALCWELDVPCVARDGTTTTIVQVDTATKKQTGTIKVSPMPPAFGIGALFAIMDTTGAEFWQGQDALVWRNGTTTGSVPLTYPPGAPCQPYGQMMLVAPAGGVPQGR